MIAHGNRLNCIATFFSRGIIQCHKKSYLERNSVDGILLAHHSSNVDKLQDKNRQSEMCYALLTHLECIQSKHRNVDSRVLFIVGEDFLSLSDYTPKLAEHSSRFLYIFYEQYLNLF